MNINQGSYYKKIIKRGVILLTICTLLVTNVPTTVQAESNTDVSNSTEAASGTEVARGQTEVLSENENVSSDVNNETAGNVAINETNFPDDAFRNYISKKFDRNNDKVLSEYEISIADSISGGEYIIDGVIGGGNDEYEE